MGKKDILYLPVEDYIVSSQTMYNENIISSFPDFSLSLSLFLTYSLEHTRF